jgi:hypothetical protein
MRTTLFFVLGPTNVGKSTLLEHAGRLPGVGLVEVGKLMRAKYLDPKSPHYDPDYFKGSAAPTHTATEAWKMMQTGIDDAIDMGAHTVFIDGQPRDVDQADGVYGDYEIIADKYNVLYVNLFAQLETRVARANARDKDEAKLRLSMQRMEADCIKIYEVISRVLLRGGKIITLATDHSTFSPADTAAMLVSTSLRSRALYLRRYAS